VPRPYGAAADEIELASKRVWGKMKAAPGGGQDKNSSLRTHQWRWRRYPRTKAVQAGQGL